ncbi:MAG: hypothetical protein ACE5IO_07005, partial [Thermoplasmata archaeon]
MHPRYKFERGWVLFISLCIASPLFLANVSANTANMGAVDRFSWETDANLFENVDYHELSGEYFLSPLTDFRYAIEKDTEAETTRFCRISDGVCYLSIPDILEDESKGLDEWMLKVAPSLRERIADETAKGTAHETNIGLIIELDEYCFRKAAKEVWNDRSVELGEMIEELTELSQEKQWNRPTYAGLLTRLDILLDSARKEIYALAEEKMIPHISSASEQIEVRRGVVRSNTPVLPAIFATASADSIPSIALLDGVRLITENSEMDAMMDVSAYAINADTWWTNGYTGGTWDLAIVDTGIDGTHPALTVDNASV